MSLDITSVHRDKGDPTKIIVEGTATDEVEIKVIDRDTGVVQEDKTIYVGLPGTDKPWKEEFPNMTPEHDFVITATRGGMNPKDDFFRLSRVITSDWTATATPGASAMMGRRKVTVAGTARKEIDEADNEIGYRGYVRIELILANGGDPIIDDTTIKSVLCRPATADGAWSYEFDDLDPDTPFVVRLSDVAWVSWADGDNTGS